MAVAMLAVGINLTMLASPAQAYTALQSAMINVLSTGPGTVACWKDVTLDWADTNTFVKADFGNSKRGLLRVATRKIDIGEWEKFTVCRNPSNWQTLIAAQYEGTSGVVSVERADPAPYNDALRARTSAYSIGPWERFTSINPPSNNGPYGPYNDTWIYSTSASKYVTGCPAAGNFLQASGSTGTVCEEFSWSGYRAY
ncbi:fascin domain-containing protein [Micromonospora chersina]|uniref:fascin domain-containing protein n=1 Tax=Micromonospora chersina TaxID=47854 RepID=UPI0033C2FF13